jgi:hypothetical protein
MSCPVRCLFEVLSSFFRNQRDRPVSKKHRAVLNFMVAAPGKIFLRESKPKNHPNKTSAPTLVEMTLAALT